MILAILKNNLEFSEIFGSLPALRNSEIYKPFISEISDRKIAWNWDKSNKNAKGYYENDLIFIKYQKSINRHLRN